MSEQEATLQLDLNTLEQIVKGITPENRHEEIDFGPPVGREIL